MSTVAAARPANMRLWVAAAAVLLGVALVVFFHFALPIRSVPDKLLSDKTFFWYPASIQNIMWIVFAVGMGELIVRWIESSREAAQMHRQYLPEDERSVLRAPDLGPIYAAVRAAPDSDQRFLPRMIRRIVLQFQSNRSIDQSHALLNSSLDLYLHEVDLRYSMLRYVMWAIPSLGFIGTVIGIALALNFAGEQSVNFDDPRLLSELADRLGVAFYTTLLALLQASFLVFLMHIVQAREEKALNDAGQYCLDNLINRLYDR